MIGRALAVAGLVTAAAIAASCSPPPNPSGPARSTALAAAAPNALTARHLAADDRDEGGASLDHASMQMAVRRALAEAVERADISFALDSAQVLRLDDNGSRIEGHGIALWADGEPRYVSFVLRLSHDGKPLHFEFGAPEPDAQTPWLADQ
jgi:hypothetical protein